MRSCPAPLRLFVVLACLVVPWVSLPGAASAQTTTFSAALRNIEGRNDTRLTTPLNIRECTEDVEITVRLSAIPTAAVLDVYYGVDCQISTNRLSTSTTKQCEPVTSVAITNAGGFQDVTFNISNLKCTETSTRKLFFLPVASEGAGGDITNGVTLDVMIDATAPSAPTSVEGGEGESAIPVSWMFTGTDVNEFIVYWDDDDTTCASMKLMAGDEDLEDLGLRSKTVNQSTRDTLLSNAVDVGQSATVGIVAVDLAGNASPLSATACITGVPTTGWLDLHEAQGGKTGNTCSVAVMNRAHGSMFVLWAMLMAVLGLRATRRHS